MRNLNITLVCDSCNHKSRRRDLSDRECPKCGGRLSRALDKFAKRALRIANGGQEYVRD